MAEIRIADKLVGDGHPSYIIAEIGINHNGSVDIAKKLIAVAKIAGCNAVKFQKRTPELCVPESQRNIMRETPWGYITYMEYRQKVEFNEDQYREIDNYCRNEGIVWFTSCWDEKAVNFIEQFDVPCFKVSSASLTDDELLYQIRTKKRPIFLSTGMSTLEQIDHAVDILGKDGLILMHSCSVYPAYYEELNLRVILKMRERYNVPIGYSGHETGIASSVAAVAIGACAIERHITLDRSMWGSDHAASLEPNGINKLVRDIRLVEAAMGDGNKKICEREIAMIARLRRKG